MHAGSRRRLGALLEQWLAGLIWLDPMAAAYWTGLNVQETFEAQGDGPGARERSAAPRRRGLVRPVIERLQVIEGRRS